MFRIHTIIPRAGGAVSVHLADDDGNTMELQLRWTDITKAADIFEHFLWSVGEAYGIAKVPVSR